MSMKRVNTVTMTQYDSSEGITNKKTYTSDSTRLCKM